MVIGNGVDLIEIGRVKKIMDRKPHFIERFFSEKERAYFQSKHMKAETIAANFAAKEAIAKAMGTGIRGFELKDIEVLRTSLGQPYVVLHKGALALSRDLGIEKWLVSLSHTATHAIAFVIATSDEKGA